MNVSRTWVYRFLNRHKEFKLQTATVADPQRNKASCIKNLLPFYLIYHNLLSSDQYHETLVFNLDETPICLHQSPKMKVLTLPEKPTPRLSLPPRMANATLLLTICLDGTYLTPHLLWPTKRIPPELTIMRGRPILLHANGSGWQTKYSFEKIMLGDILPTAMKKRKDSGLGTKKILFVLDSHVSRMSIKLLKYCKKNRITLLTIPAHSSHLTQPLDCGPNGNFKHSLLRYTILECCRPRVCCCL